MARQQSWRRKGEKEALKKAPETAWKREKKTYGPKLAGRNTLWPS